jgi:hypothetical protein
MVDEQGHVFLQVAKRFLAAVKESSGPTLNMGFFISCDPEDIMKQAEESTLRYQRGKIQICISLYYIERNYIKKA